ncbi:hypothetical protein [Cellulomonas soli]
MEAIRHSLTGAPVDARQRLTAALAEIPGPAADATLAALVDDPERGVALTATSLLRTRSPHGQAREGHRTWTAPGSARRTGPE